VNPYRILGVDGDATEADVKRAYARLLKQHRPDVDPTGFQRLHEAYTHCLSHARYRAQYGVECYDEEYEGDEPATEASEEFAVLGETERHSAADAVSQPMVAVDDMGTASFETEFVATLPESEAGEDHALDSSFNTDAFIDELLERARHRHPGELSRWLTGHEALYSLQLKQFLTGQVASALAESDPLPDEKNVHVVLEFFGLDGVGHDHWMEQLLQQLWQRIEDRREFEQLRLKHYVRATQVDRMLFTELVSPRSWLRFLAILLCPNLPSRTRNVLVDIEIHAPYSARAQVNPAAAEFWRRASDRNRLDWRRWLLVLLRLPWILLVAGYLAVVTERGVSAKATAITLGSALAGWLVLASGLIAWRRLLQLNNEKLQWDMPVVLASAMLGIAVLMGFFHPGWSIPICVVTMMGWLAQRHGGEYYAGMFAAAFGGALVLSVWMLVLPEGTPQSPWSFVVAGVYGAANVLVHDALYARVNDQPLVWARGQLGWLGWLLLGNAILTVGTLMAGS
jgi:hypothetical protein